MSFRFPEGSFSGRYAFPGGLRSATIVSLGPSYLRDTLSAKPGPRLF
jgi:hypothetical protein